MTGFYHSLRSWEELAGGIGICWVATKTNEQTVAVALEVPSGRLSSRAGFQDTAVALGRGIAEYFVGGHHHK